MAYYCSMVPIFFIDQNFYMYASVIRSSDVRSTYTQGSSYRPKKLH